MKYYTTKELYKMATGYKYFAGDTIHRILVRLDIEMSKIYQSQDKKRIYKFDENYKYPMTKLTLDSWKKAYHNIKNNQDIL